MYECKRCSENENARCGFFKVHCSMCDGVYVLRICYGCGGFQGYVIKGEERSNAGPIMEKRVHNINGIDRITMGCTLYDGYNAQMKATCNGLINPKILKHCFPLDCRNKDRFDTVLLD